MKRKLLLFSILSALLLTGCSLPNIFQKKFAAINISTKPESEVFLDDEKVGETPFVSEKLKSKDYLVRLVPKDEKLSPWETTVTLHPNITTVINYEFGKERQESSGSILTLEPVANKQAVEIAVISLPDNASIKLDGQPRGFTPIQVKDLTPGAHTLIVSAPGYKQQQIEIKTVEGHKLTVDVQLAKEALFNQEATPSAEVEEDKEEEPDTRVATPTPKPAKPASPSAKQIDKPYVEILDTPTGWLRVRSSPTTAEDNEITKINPGERYSYLESNDTGWHKILLDDGEEGWISGRYAKVVK